MSDLLWSITADEVVRYTEGDCWLLAFELGRILNAPLVSLCDPLDQDEWHHVTVDLGCETLLDAVGVHSRVVLSAAWEKRTKGHVTLRELGRFSCLDAYLRVLDGEHLGRFISHSDEKDARQLAQTITTALTEGFHDDHDYLHSWAARRRQEQMGY